MKITFVLPPNPNKPMGGYKIVYQYANEMVKRGHEVSIVFLKNVFPSLNWYSWQNIKNIINDYLGRSLKNITEVSWYPIDSAISLYFDSEKESDFPDADVIIATAAPTTYISKFGKNKGRKFYFIQGFETWWYKGREERLFDTYKIPNMTNIVISHELEKKVNSISQHKSQYLPNFYDSKEFFVENKLEERRNVVALLNHQQDSKRTLFGIEILKEVHKQIPDLRVELFGVPDAPPNLPSYFNVTKMASATQLRVNIFGKAKIYLLPSVMEGWGLTGIESMASGATLVASRIGGIVDYANESNSRLIQPDDKEQFVNVIVELLRNVETQQKIARKGIEDAQLFRIDRAGESLENILQRK